jgi:PAS domain S-box-containing protein
MKLLAKTAEDRYQTAAGLERDLRRCLAQWEAARWIDAFPLGAHDTPDRLVLPEKLYGRARAIDTLRAAFDRVVTSGMPELVLVSGAAGIGKSAVVHELHTALVPSRGLFAAGKFDQYKRDIPYATLAQALQSLIRHLLGQSEAELDRWRAALREALEPNGRLMTDLVPALTLLLGDQPPVPELAPKDAQRRFQLVFRRFIGVFARPDQPLALFLDDLQWLDAGTLDMLEDLLTQRDVQHVLLIGAYRDNEVAAAHPLQRTLGAIREAGARVREISLAPLTRHDVGQLLADGLRCAPGRVAPLAQLVHAKTAGNPFFALQFLAALADEGVLTFEHGQGGWSWDLERLHATGYTDNVADLMVGKLHRLPVATQAALQQLACLGHSAATATLALVHETSEEEVHAQLWEAVRTGVIERLESAYTFIHDRVQEAVYSFIPEEGRAAAHLRIGRLLIAHTPPEERDEAIFELVHQLNRGAVLITDPKEREQLAALNLLAGTRAKQATAYASALTYLRAGAALVAEDGWERQHALAFALECHRAACEFLTGALAAAAERLTVLSTRAATTVEHATVACLRMDVHATLGQSGRAIAVGLDYLRRVGIDWSPQPADEDVRREYERIWTQLGGRTVEELIALPLMHDPVALATLDVLTRLVPPARHMDGNLVALVICRAVNLSLERGNSDGSCFAYAMLGWVAGPHFGNYQAGVRFGQLSYDLIEQRGLRRFQAITYLVLGNAILLRSSHVRAGCALVRRAFEAANKSGDLTCAAYCCCTLNSHLLAAGDPLAETQREAEHGLAFAQQMRFGFIIDVISTQLGLIRTLRGLTRQFGSLDDAQFDERRIERHFADNPAWALSECWYWIRKLQARYMAGDYAAAVEAASQVHRLLWTAPSPLEAADFHLYGALSHAAWCDSAAADQRPQHVEALAAHHRQLAIWAEHGPEHFANRAALVGAELARLEGRELEAMRLYEQAIQSARANGFVHHEALAHELAGRFALQRGFETAGAAHLRHARACYALWGADGKVRQLDERYPHLRQAEPAPDARGTIGTPIEHLELATVLNVSQAVSGELVLDTLVETLLRTALEHAGAERGLLLVPRDDNLSIQAEATTSGSAVQVRLGETPISAAALPESVVRYAARTHERVLLDDAAGQHPFTTDAYLRAQHARSVLCVPLVKQGALVALLYLENTLAPHVFTPARLAVLQVLASEAAMALENSRLYRALQAREAQIRRLVDANIIGITLWDRQSRTLEANDAFLALVGYSREELASGRMPWPELTAAEWRGIDEQRFAELRATGRSAPVEKEYVRKDGRRVPVLVGSATFEGQQDAGVSFVLDLTERKRAEALLAGEKRLLEMIATGQALSTILEALCRLIEELSPGSLASILLLDPDGQRLWHGAAPSLPQSYTNAIDGGLIGPAAGSCGTAAYRKAPVIVADIAQDPLWAEYRELALPHGLRACWSTPLLASNGRVLGTFAIYARAPSSPTPQQHNIIEQITNLTSIAIERKRAEEERQAHLGFLETMDQVNRAIQGTNDLEQMLSDVLDVLLTVLQGDRAWLVYPCDPDARWHGVRMQRTRPEFPGLFSVGLDVPVDAETADVLRTVRAASGPVRFGPGAPHPLPPKLAQRLGIQSRLVMALYPKGDQPYLFGLSQCAYPRVWTLQEERLFQEIGRRLEDALTSLLMLRTVRDSERKLEEAQHLAHVGYWEHDPETDRLTWSDETYRIFGLQPQAQLLSLAQLPALIHPEDQQIMVQAVAEALRGGRRYDVEYRVVRPTGEVRIVHSQGDVLRDESGRPHRMFGTVQDITERKRAEQRLLAHHTVTQILAEAARLEDATPKLLQAVCEGLLWDLGVLWSRDREAGVMRCVEVWHKASVEAPHFEATCRVSTFLPEAGLPGRVWSSRAPAYIPDVVQDANFPRAPIAAREGLHTAFAFPILLGGDVLGVMEFFSREIRQPDPDLLTMMATIGSQIGQFIERKRAEEALHQAQMELAHVARVVTLGELTASIAHEINQPLTAVVTNGAAGLRWLQRDRPDLDEACAAVQRVVREGRRASDVLTRIRGLLQRAPAALTPLDIQETIEEVLLLVRAEARRQQITLHTVFGAEVPPVLGDRVQVQQVLLNLVRNSMEAMRAVVDRPRDLRVQTQRQALGGVLVSVQDSGIGLRAEEVEQMFEPFFSTKPGGMGMGLRISRAIVEAHGGQLWARPNAEHGATFVFTLPTGAEERG